MIEATITDAERIILPDSVRDALDLKTGDRLRYFIIGGEVRVVKAGPITRLKGALKYDGPPVSIEEMNRATRKLSRLEGVTLLHTD